MVFSPGFRCMVVCIPLEQSVIEEQEPTLTSKETNMNVTDIPFVKHTGIERNADGRLALPFTPNVQNHLETFHASAQFTLAETASGEHLRALFPDLEGKVIPVLRDAQVKFKKPAKSQITAHASAAEEAVSSFKEQFAKKGRSTIEVQVELRDVEDNITCVGKYQWFVQQI